MTVDQITVSANAENVHLDNPIENVEIELSIDAESVDDSCKNVSPQSASEIIPDRIFVGNLPYEVSEDEVRNLTPEFDVVSVEIPRRNYFNQHQNRYVLQSKGYGFITYVNADDARQAIDSIIGKFISGREIYAKYALPQNKPKFQNQQHQQHQHQQNQQNQNQHPQHPQHPQNSQHPQYGQHMGIPIPIPMPPFRYGPAPPNFMPQFIPIPAVQIGNEYSNIPTIKFEDPKLIEPFYPQKIEIPDTAPTSVSSSSSNSIELNGTLYPYRLSREEKRKKLEEGEASELSIFIGNLERNVTVNELETYLKGKEVGEFVKIKIPKKNVQPDVYLMLKANRVRIQNRGIGFVQFKTHEEQIDAIEKCNGDVWKGKKLNVTVAVNVDDEI